MLLYPQIRKVYRFDREAHRLPAVPTIESRGAISKGSFFADGAFFMINRWRGERVL